MVFQPMHPITRLGRVIQQLRSFADLHASELEGLARELDTGGASDQAGRVRAYRDIQRDETQLAVNELVDIQADMTAAATTSQAADGPAAPTAPPAPAAPNAANPRDPAVNSPRRAKWLAEQAAEAERLRQPVTRRDLFGRATPKATADETDAAADVRQT
jgi:hypothetical protein